MSDYEAVKKIAAFAKLNPAAFQAWLVKWLAIVVIVGGLCFTSYWQGAQNENDKWEAKIASQRATVAQQRGNNAVDAGKRLGDFKYNDAQLDAAVAAAKLTVHEFYAKNPPDPRVVERTKLVPVPGKEEYVYVPIGTCPNDFLDADELLLWNLGNSGNFTDSGDPK